VKSHRKTTVYLSANLYSHPISFHKTQLMAHEDTDFSGKT